MGEMGLQAVYSHRDGTASVEAGCTWSPSWTGTLGTSSPGNWIRRWSLLSSSRPCVELSTKAIDRGFSTATRGATSKRMYTLKRQETSSDRRGFEPRPAKEDSLRPIEEARICAPIRQYFQKMKLASPSSFRIFLDASPAASLKKKLSPAPRKLVRDFFMSPNVTAILYRPRLLSKKFRWRRERPSYL